ncbi:MAG TPA: uracil-DNA glycosylase family protein [Thermoanaerobaculia bacterium]|nr:uracil-DNA glycosylase family protein [Thermoanaerobaculia bacterium]
MRSDPTAVRRHDAFAGHLEQLFACRACPGVAGAPVTGAVRGARILLVGQAPGPRENDERKPFAWTAGRRLFSWFDAIGVTESRFRDRVYIAAAIRCFPGRSPQGGDRVPSKEEVARCGLHLDREIVILRPDLVIGVGALAADLLLGDSSLARLVGKKHQATRAGRRFEVIVLPHPSGRSTWLNRDENRALLDRSLALIRRHPAWKATFDS